MLLAVFWLSLIQVSVSHATEHALETENTCLICMSHANLGSATLNSNICGLQVVSADVPYFDNSITFIPVSQVIVTNRGPPEIQLK